jgi:DNA-binding winged helix-turn-helix (wHTH) protein
VTPPDLFPGPVKAKILKVLADAAPGQVHARDLCRLVYGDVEQKNRDVMRNLIMQMRPKLEEHGYAIDGRNELKAHAYRLRSTVL